MADESSSSSGPRVERHVLWVAVAGMASLLLLSLVALSMAFLLGRNQPLINIDAGNNSQAGANLPPNQATSPLPASRPDTSGAPQGHRFNGQVPSNTNALPNATGVETERSADGDMPTRADTQSPPFYTTLTPAAKVYFRVRVIPGGPSGLKGPMPFRVREWQPLPDGTVSNVVATVPSAQSDEDTYSYLPEVDYKASSGKGKVLSVKVLNPRKTSIVNELRAPKGFQFLVAEIQVTNVGKAAYQIDPDIFEIQDSDHVPYLMNPELLSADFPQSAIPAGKSASFTASFLVPADVNLSSLASHEPGDGLVFSPLTPQ